MKKYIYAMMLVLTGITMMQAQRMIPGQKGFEISAGSLSCDSPWRNYYVNLGLTANGKNGSYKLWALEYSHQYSKYKGLRLPLETFIAEGGYSFFVVGDCRRNVALNAAIAGVLGYEKINRGKDLLQDGAKIISEDGFLYGAGGRLSFETYLCDHLVLLLQGRIKVLWATDLQQFRPSAGLGVRYNF
ncbi:conjugal transfer protein TraO [Flavobacterium sp. MR2016-29]|uniref:conjugal transfer protein TraO n=1 Tax=Flavobacterium sp. MR2016-29 TaxID=2783795 RepID=UPI00188B4F75|nr:conjugal transfer protein TraO [Flavobacterium sp. MR2016-29]MBF4491520.1 conjugal transfer protein TraO [Flavobacterium sp. MR2016-29]